MEIPEIYSKMIDIELARQHAAATLKVASLQTARESSLHRERVNSWLDILQADLLETDTTMAALATRSTVALELGPGSELPHMCETCNDGLHKATCDRKCLSPVAVENHFTPVKARTRYELPKTPLATMRAIRLAEMMKPVPKHARRHHLNAQGPKRPGELGPLWSAGDDRLIDGYAVHFTADAKTWQHVLQKVTKVDKVRLNQLRRRGVRATDHTDKQLKLKYGDQFGCTPKAWTPVKQRAREELNATDYTRLRRLRRMHRNNESIRRSRATNAINANN